MLFGLSDLLGRSLYKKLKEKDFKIIGFSKRKKDWFSDEFFYFDNFSDVELEADFFIYLAAISGEFQVEKNYLEALEVNLIFPIRVLEKIKSGHFIYISSASVYDNTLFPEEEDAKFRSSLYGSQKFAGEGLLLVLSKKKNLKFTSIRFPRIFGPFMERNPIADFLKALREKRDTVYLYDDYSARYEYIFSYDAACYIISVMELSLEGIYNCGSGVVKSVEEIKDIFEKLTRKKFKVEFLKRRKGVDVLNSEKIKKILKKTMTDFEEALKRTIEEEKLL
ncbi:MAG: NAD(P)-dependent oxidoreductase [Candidatus Hydrothermales bacterium]